MKIECYVSIKEDRVNNVDLVYTLKHIDSCKVRVVIIYIHYNIPKCLNTLHPLIVSRCSDIKNEFSPEVVGII